MAEFLHTVEGTSRLEPGNLKIVKGVVDCDLLSAAIFVQKTTLQGLKAKNDKRDISRHDSKTTIALTVNKRKSKFRRHIL